MISFDEINNKKFEIWSIFAFEFLQEDPDDYEKERVATIKNKFLDEIC